jgi:uncharacterized SAM-binding protein YcdF (DUF218 family)
MSLFKEYWKVFVLPFVVIALVLFSILFYVNTTAVFENKEVSQAILVLGAEANGNNAGDCLSARMDHAIELYQKRVALKLILSGTKDEVEAMKTIANAANIADRELILENKSESTYENLVNSKDIMDSKNIVTVVIVTDPFHQARASLVANKLQYHYTLSPAKDSPCWTKSSYISYFPIREALAIILYKVEGKL